jgi:hypothetical protein
MKTTKPSETPQTQTPDQIALPEKEQVEVPNLSLQPLHEVSTREELQAFGKTSRRWQSAKWPELSMYFEPRSQTVHMHWNGAPMRGVRSYIILPFAACQYIAPAPMNIE